MYFKADLISPITNLIYVPWNYSRNITNDENSATHIEFRSTLCSGHVELNENKEYSSINDCCSIAKKFRRLSNLLSSVPTLRSLGEKISPIMIKIFKRTQ